MGSTKPTSDISDSDKLIIGLTFVLVIVIILVIIGLLIKYKNHLLKLFNI